MPNRITDHDPNKDSPAEGRIEKRDINRWVTTNYVVASGRSRATYSDPENINKIVIEETPHAIDVGTQNRKSITAAAFIADSRDWKAVWLDGTDRFKRSMWSELSRLGIKANGYSPTPDERRDLVKQRKVDQANRDQIKTLRKSFRDNLLERGGVSDQSLERAMKRFDKRAGDELSHAFHNKEVVALKEPAQVYTRSPLSPDRTRL